MTKSCEQWRSLCPNYSNTSATKTVLATTFFDDLPKPLHLVRILRQQPFHISSSSTSIAVSASASLNAASPSIHAPFSQLPNLPL